MNCRFVAYCVDCFCCKCNNLVSFVFDCCLAPWCRKRRSTSFSRVSAHDVQWQTSSLERRTWRSRAFQAATPANHRSRTWCITSRRQKTTADCPGVHRRQWRLEPFDRKPLLSPRWKLQQTKIDFKIVQTVNSVPQCWRHLVFLVAQWRAALIVLIISIVSVTMPAVRVTTLIVDCFRILWRSQPPLLLINETVNLKSAVPDLTSPTRQFSLSCIQVGTSWRYVTSLWAVVRATTSWFFRRGETDCNLLLYLTTAYVF